MFKIPAMATIVDKIMTFKSLFIKLFLSIHDCKFPLRKVTLSRQKAANNPVSAKIINNTM
jgi:hypothetical protein